MRKRANRQLKTNRATVRVTRKSLDQQAVHHVHVFTQDSVQ
jgi:hypothetical protein